MMYGAIIGDIAGSRFEFDNYRGKDFEIFSPDSFCTDDTLMTIAVAGALKEAKENGYEDLEDTVVKYMQCIGRKHPNAGWGASFGAWLKSDNPEPYYSFGNGAAMRVSACGWYGRSKRETLELAERVTKVTHDHPEGIKGAQAVAVAIYLARTGASKREIYLEMVKDYYPELVDYTFTVDNIRPKYQFNETCQDTVPQAIRAFYEGKDFEDVIRTAVSLGGDSDTLAAIAGSIAEAYYGIPCPMISWANIYIGKTHLKLAGVAALEVDCEGRRC